MESFEFLWIIATIFGINLTIQALLKNNMVDFLVYGSTTFLAILTIIFFIKLDRMISGDLNGRKNNTK